VRVSFARLETNVGQISMRRASEYVHASLTRECFAYLILSFALSWIAWIPVLLASRRNEQLGDLLIIGTFGPSVSAILLSSAPPPTYTFKLIEELSCRASLESKEGQDS
jgi:hypothetical protein